MLSSASCNSPTKAGSPLTYIAFSTVSSLGQHLRFLCRYAQRSKASRLEWSAFTKEYFLKRETLANVLLLVDSSIPVQACTLAPDLIK